MLAHLNCREMARPKPLPYSHQGLNLGPHSCWDVDSINLHLMINRPELSRSFPCPRSRTDSATFCKRGLFRVEHIWLSDSTRTAPLTFALRVS